MRREEIKAMRKPHVCARCRKPLRRARPAVRLTVELEYVSKNRDGSLSPFPWDAGTVRYYHPECETAKGS